MRRPSASTSAEKPHSPTPARSVSIVERTTTSTDFTGPLVSCTGLSAETLRSAARARWIHTGRKPVDSRLEGRRGRADRAMVVGLLSTKGSSVRQTRVAARGLRIRIFDVDAAELPRDSIAVHADVVVGEERVGHDILDARHVAADAAGRGVHGARRVSRGFGQGGTPRPARG